MARKLPTPFHADDFGELYLGDCFDLFSGLHADSFDLIFADPPYFLSNGGISCSGGRQVSVNKGSWDEGATPAQRHAFNRRWIHRCRRVLKETGTIWVSGTMHNIYSIGMALEQEGFKILNNITWQKTNPPPNLACRCFTHSTETVLWAKFDSPRARHCFNYQDMKAANGGKQMKDVWMGSLTRASEKTEGKHPTQKPEYLLERILLASSKEGDVVLDPFVGSGTTAVVAKKLGRRYVGFDAEREYLEIARRRLLKVESADAEVQQ